MRTTETLRRIARAQGRTVRSVTFRTKTTGLAIVATPKGQIAVIVQAYPFAVVGGRVNFLNARAKLAR